jgi:pyruvate kinase
MLSVVREGSRSPILPKSIGCTLPQVFGSVQPGHRVWFDDGKIAGVVSEVGEDGFSVLITQASPTGSKLRMDKGINLPDTELAVPFLSDVDRRDLAFAAKHADLVGLSFVQSSENLDELASELRTLGAERPRAQRHDLEQLGVMLKIETRRAFERLPSLLLTSLGRWPVGVMIARGDLALEVGYERLAEVQEEILWVSEAAHVPVVWATAVLESLAKKGVPSRAEITDAAMSQRAECVMLNKGPYTTNAIRLLDDILRRMQAHQRKKTAFLRPLRAFSKEHDTTG